MLAALPDLMAGKETALTTEPGAQAVSLTPAVSGTVPFFRLTAEVCDR